MHVLLTAATEAELPVFSPGAVRIDTLITGVGVPSTLYQLSKRLHQIDYDLVVQVGIAGSFGDHWRSEGICWVKEDCFADIGAVEKGTFCSVFDMKLASPDAFPYSGGWLRNPQTRWDTLPFPAARAVTVNTVTDEPAVIQRLNQAFLPGIETMEGAACHLVCLEEGQEFLQLRAVSNQVGDRNKQNWRVAEAVSALSNGLQELFNILIQKS